MSKLLIVFLLSCARVVFGACKPKPDAAPDAEPEPTVDAGASSPDAGATKPGKRKGQADGGKPGKPDQDGIYLDGRVRRAPVHRGPRCARTHQDHPLD